MLETALVARFGPLSAAMSEALAEADAESMKRWHCVALTAPSLQAVGILSAD
jgi:hypothetical protein